MDRKDYETRLADLQEQLVHLQWAYGRQKRKAIIVLEGWDASGKGGVIRRLAWAMDPRPLKVWQIGAPSAEERTSHWMRRFWKKIPNAGEIAVFDRSWYGRVLVERVEGFASEGEWRRAYAEIRDWEHSLHAEGYRLVKLFLDITREEQLKRFEARYREPAKRWKLTPDDLRNRSRWDDYGAAYREMLDETSTDLCPWVHIDANKKKRARLEAFDAILKCLGEGVDLAPAKIDPAVTDFFEPGEKSASP